MSLSSVQIWQSLQQSEIASAVDCRQWASEILESAGSAALENPQLLLAQLVKSGRLTPFQANALLSNETLTIGQHRLLAPLDSPALSNWFEAIDPSSNAACWLYAISIERLKEPALDRHPPSLKLARQHATVRVAGLQNLSPPSLVDGYLLIAAAPASGQPLRELLKSYPRRALPAELAFKMITRIASALAALHSAGIVHGRIGIDQIWWDNKEEITLLRDPFFPPLTPLGPNAPTAVGVVDDQDYRIRYAAPEFTAPGQSPTFATDIYALGCLWWELMMGQLPYADTMMDQVPTATCKFPLAIPQDLGLTTGQRRCLDHMLAKNPSNRFANAQQLVAALDAVNSTPLVPSVASSIVPVPPVTASLPEASSKGIEAPKIAEQTKAKPIASSDRKKAAAEKPSASVSIAPNIKPPTSSVGRRIKKKKSRPVWLLPSMLGGSFVILGGLVWLLTGNGSSTSRPKATVANPGTTAANGSQKLPAGMEGEPAPTIATQTPAVDPIEEQYLISREDEALPWVPPRPSRPYSLTMLPPGAQGYIFVRPHAWLTTQAGQSVLQSLASSIDMLWKPIEEACGLSPESMDELAIGLYPGRSDGWPVMAYRIRLKDSISLAELKKGLSNATEQMVTDKLAMLVTGDQAIFLDPEMQPADSTNQCLAVGPVSLIRELVEMEGGSGPLRRQMEQLWQVSDAQSDLCLLLNTGFIFSDARNLLPSISPRVQSLCKTLLDEKTQALMISTSLEPQWYGELRVIGQSVDDATRFTKDVRARMKAIADSMEAELVADPASPYWRAIAARYPQMLRALTRYLRFGIENGQAISNFYLPSAASANMTIATWMTIQKPGATATSIAPTPATKSLLGDDLLAHPVSIHFEQEPLDSALALLTEEINRSLPVGSGPIAISIDGKSFELASVTRNQQIRDFQFKDQPLRVLLTDIASRINPDRTVKSLDEVKQAVVWVLTESEGKSNIVFTTRRGIEGSDRTLPKEFATPSLP